jgi:phage baseplate assembly protein W
MFDIGSDNKIWESSVKMLLKTKRGDRVMEPRYGTNLQQLLFENDPNTVMGLASQEVTRALSQWEPRVQLLNLSARNNGDRSISLDLTLLSKLSQQPFEANVMYER